MGMIFGKISEEQPKYEVVEKKDDVEIRKYAPRLVAEVTYTGSHFQSGSDGGFMTLAGYLGVMGKPNNVKREEGGEGEKIAMTSPVITQEKGGQGEKIAMTSPVITVENKDKSTEKTKTTMQFVLPSKYSLETIPKPTDSMVSIKEVPEEFLGVITFNGTTNYTDLEKYSEKLREGIKNLGWNITGDYVLARFNPPWTIPVFRKNEILYPVEKKE